jgi:LysM repeat protein
MQVLPAVRRVFLILLAGGAALLAGCGPAVTGAFDETREPHFRRASSLLQGRQHARAAEEFQRALEVNPRSPSAHLQLALLHHHHLNQPDAAIHHYRQYLRHGGDAEEDKILPRIEECRRLLAGPIAVPVINEQLVRRVEVLQVERSNLLAQLEGAHFNLAQASNDVLRLTGLLVRLQAQGFTSAPAPAVLPSSAAPASAAAQPPGRTAVTPAAAAPVRAAARPALQPAPRPANPPPASPMLNHYIRRGDTVGSLARRYGTTSDAILRANPGVDPRRLREGQKILIPRR